MGKRGGRGTATTIEHRHVGKDLVDQGLGLDRIATGLDHRTPGRQVGVAAIAGGLGIGDHHGDARAGQIIPVLDVLGVALVHQDHGHRRGGRAVVGKPLGPFGRDQLTALGQQVDVIGLVHGDDVGFQAVNHTAGLLAGAAVRLVDGQGLAGRLLPVFGEGDVVVLVKLAGDVVAHVEQGGVGPSGADHGRRRQDTHGNMDNLFLQRKTHDKTFFDAAIEC